MGSGSAPPLSSQHSVGPLRIHGPQPAAPAALPCHNPPLRAQCPISQVLFLLYHYFEAREAYNAIRIFIAGYVWMTGFGNFSYYYRWAAPVRIACLSPRLSVTEGRL